MNDSGEFAGKKEKTMTSAIESRTAETSGQIAPVVLRFSERCLLPVGCVKIAETLGLKAGDRLVSDAIDRHAPYGTDHSFRDALWHDAPNRFAEVMIVIRFVGAMYVVSDRHSRTSSDGVAWCSWDIQEAADISSGVWNWLKEYRADWRLVRGQ